MKFMLMGLEPRGEWEQLDADEMHRRVRQHQQLLDDLAMTRLRSGPPGLIFATFGLSEAREVVTVKCEGGRHACVDGPFPETKEVIGGFDIVEFPTRQAAVDWNTALPRHPSHVSEIRPIREYWWVSGAVDRERLPAFERRPPRTQAAVGTTTVFMLTCVADEHTLLSRPESERKQIDAEHLRAGASYVRQRSVADQEPGMWLGVRLTPSAEAATIHWSAQGPRVSEGPIAPGQHVITGFDVVACTSHEEAVSWARKLAARDGEAIEIRPVRGCWWLYHE